MGEPSPPPDTPDRAHLTLRDGARVEVRAVEPSDTSLLEELLERMSPESRFRRFLARVDRLSTGQLAYLTMLDHDRQDALVALDGATGEPIAVARYAALADEPDTAEVAVAVSDAWQRRGLGGLLFARLAERAEAHGIRRLSALMFRDNAGMRALMLATGPLVARRFEGSTVEIVVALRDR